MIVKKNQKKKITDSEIEFCEKLIKQIDKFCQTPSKANREKYDKFKKSQMNINSYISKYRIKDAKGFKRMILRYEHKSKSINISKYDQVKSKVADQFEKERNEGKNIHYRHLQKWATNESKSFNLKKKCNSVSFTNSIKRKYKYVSRRVQFKRNMVTTTEEDILRKSDQFVEEVNQLIPQYSPDRIFNTDQTGINYEPSQKRTLEVRGII